jgi:hypothetical protein
VKQSTGPYWILSYQEVDGERLECYDLKHEGEVSVAVDRLSDGMWLLRTHGPHGSDSFTPIEQIFESLTEAKEVGLVQARLGPTFHVKQS